VAPGGTLLVLSTTRDIERIEGGSWCRAELSRPEND
jgi:hypothetical protein